MKKIIVKIVFSICLLTNFYNSKSMISNLANNEENKVLFCQTCAEGDLEKVKSLLSRYGKDIINKTDKHSRTPLQCACTCRKSPEVAKFLLPLCEKNTINMVFQNGKTIFSMTCLSGNLDCAKELLPYITMASVNYVDSNGFTPLFHACFTKKLDIVKFILPYCTMDTINKGKNRSPLFWPCHHENVEIVRLLLEYGANVDRISRDHLQLLISRDKARKINNKNKTEILRLLDIVDNFDDAEDKRQFLLDKKPDTGIYTLLLKRFFSKGFKIKEEQEMFNNLKKQLNSKNKPKDCRVITLS